MMSFISAVVTSRYSTTNNQLRNSTYTPGASGSNSRKQRTVICYNCKGEGHMSKQCTKPKRKRDNSWFKDKVLLAQAQANGQILHEEELAFLANPGITEDVLAGVQNSDNMDNNMINQDVQARPSSEQLSVVNHSETEITSDSNIIPYSQTTENPNSCEQSVEIDHLKQTLFEQLKEKESLMQTVTLLKNDFKKEESRNIDREISLEKKIKQLNNIVYKRDQSAQTVHMLTKPYHVFLDLLPLKSLDLSPSCRPTKVEVPKELPKVNMVNTSLKKLKYHLAGFDVVVKERTMATTITEGSWRFEHTKAYFKDEIIPFVKALKDIFHTFDQYLIDELTEAYKQLYDSIKPTRIRSKEQCDALINQVNQNSMEIFDLNVSLQEKDLVITALKGELRKLKGKDLADNVVTKNTIALEMLKIDVEPKAPRLLNNRTTHSDYLRHTQDQAVILREIVEQVKSQNPLNNSLDSAFKSSLKNKNCVVEPNGTANVQHSKLNVNSELLCVKCNGCMLSDNHDLCVLNFINDVNARVKSKSFKKSSKRKVWKPTRKVFTNVGYTWRPTGQNFTIVGNACPLTRITTTAEVPHSKPTALETDTPKPVVTLEPSKSWGSIVSNVPSFSLEECRNDHVAKILGYGDYQIGNVMISRVYYVEGLLHNLFSVRQFYDSNLEVAFLQHTCFIRNLEARHGLVKGLPKLKFEKDHLCSACAMGTSKKKPHKPKFEDTNQEKLYLLHMDLCGPMHVASVNGKKYILVIVDDYSRFTWVKCLRSKDEAPDFIIKFLKMIQLRLKAPV
ncbi:retrovirus-related pol polyprotein from transposon TNT 1-94 [Tanacetum coccineum]